MDICIRLSDNKLFTPSYPDGATPESMYIAEYGHDGIAYYFRGIRWNPRKYFWCIGGWESTGEIWEFNDETLFKYCKREGWAR